MVAWEIRIAMVAQIAMVAWGTKLQDCVLCKTTAAREGMKIKCGHGCYPSGVFLLLPGYSFCAFLPYHGQIVISKLYQTLRREIDRAEYSVYNRAMTLEA